jgi:RND family efflux transporter MFP subunit
MRRTLLLALAALIVIGAGGCVDRAAQKQNKLTAETLQNPVMPVTVQTAKRMTLTDSLEITGQVVTSDDVAVGAKVGGRVVSVYVKDGDPIRAGGTIAALDATSYRLQVQQAMSMVSAARASLNQAMSNAKINPSRSSSAVAAAEAQLRSARAQLQKAKKGARDEEKIQAANNVNAARSNLNTAKKELERKRKLLEEGAISRQQFDITENAYQAALSQYENALQAQSISQSASRPEDLESAAELVRQAEEGVRSAKAQKKLDILLDDQVQAARANLQSAQAQLALARENANDAIIRSPFTGKIAGKPVQIGAVVGAGTAVAHVIGAQGAYFEGEVSENSISKVKVGGRVEVSIDALDGQKLSGSVVAISPLGSEVGRLFRVRVQIIGNMAAVRPGMFARGAVIMRTLPDVTVIPSTAIVQRGDQNYVYVLTGDTVKLTKVTTGLTTDGVVQVIGFPTDQKIVVSGQNTLDDGSKVKVETPKADAPTGVTNP